MVGTATENPSRRIPPGVWALSYVSLLMDVSSEMNCGLPPLFLVTMLGANAVTVRPSPEREILLSIKSYF